MLDQFLSKKTWWILGALPFVHILAFFCLHRAFPSLVVLLCVGFITLYLSWKNLSWGLSLALLEIVVGGHGHLFDLQIGSLSLSVRMVIFLGVYVAWIALMIFRGLRPRLLLWRDGPICFFIAAVLFGTTVGFLRANPLGALFDDANSYLTLFYFLPLASITWSGETRALFLRTLFSGALWIATFTLLLLFAFTHLPQQYFWELYVFVRDCRLFEITLLSNPRWLVGLFMDSPWYVRVFGYGQFYLFVAYILFLFAFFRSRHISFWTLALHVLFFSACLATLSRSFLLGAVAGGAVSLGYSIVCFWRRDAVVRFREILPPFIALIGTCAASFVLLWGIVALPIPSRPDLSQSPFYKGQNDQTRALAVSSRWNLLPPLMHAIAQHPVVGSGFGREVTYISDDPRLREDHPTGEYTTYRFEWGFQDVWLKMGFLGLLAVIGLLGSILSRAIVAQRRGLSTSWLSVGLAVGTVFLYVTHIFSPFLNHPIGLMLLLFAAFLADSGFDKPLLSAVSPSSFLKKTRVLLPSRVVNCRK